MSAPFDGPGRVASDLLVGEIRALRTFRLTGDGELLPVAHGTQPWSDGPNTARCERGGHTPAAPGCSCGFYAYGTRRAAYQHAEARQVLAVVACWGRVVPGTLGLRAQHARIEALWVTRWVPRERIALVRRRYPSVAWYESRRGMLRRHRPTLLDSYERLSLLRARRAGHRFPFNAGQLGVGALALVGYLLYSIVFMIVISGVVLAGNGVVLLIRFLLRLL
jgi:hypothetical protein